MLQDVWEQEEPISHGLQRILGPWDQDSTACAEARRQQFTTKASSETPEWTEAGQWVRRPLCRKVGDSPFPHLGSQSPCCAASPRCPGFSGAFYGNTILRKPLVTGVTVCYQQPKKGIKGLSCLL